MAAVLTEYEQMEDRDEIFTPTPAAFDHQFDGAPRGRYRNLLQSRLVAHVGVAVAVYLALIAGLALHGLDVPDPTPTSSLGNSITSVPALREHRRDRE